MKREIKFRAWDKHKKCFIPNDVYAILNTTSFGAFGIMIKDWEDYREGEFFYDYAQKVTQFTGLKDKNGKDIYEGDIVRKDKGSHEFYDISFEAASYWLGPYPDDMTLDCDCLGVQVSPKSLEVIGNIYENPELL